jgi:hypothetical protein
LSFAVPAGILKNIRDSCFGWTRRFALALMAGWSRWLELRLPEENHTRAWLTRLWPVCISLIGILLLNYREMCFKEIYSKTTDYQ